MCPSIAVLAGGGDMGNGSGGSAGDGSGDEHAGANKGGENAEGDGRGAPDYEKYPQCGYASHPVDVVTGRAFTHPIVDLALPGPLPLTWRRMYSAKAAALDLGMGYGWAHTFGWKVEVKRRSIIVWNEQGIAVDFPMIPPGAEVIGPWGWVLRRETWGFAVDADDGVWHLFSEPDPRSAGFFLLTAVEDRNRNRIALTYDDGRLVEVVDSAGRIVRVGQTRQGRIASIQVQNAITQGQWVAFATFTYDERGDLVAATDADGFTARYAYDDDHRLTLDEDRAGLTFHFVYDGEGRCIESWGDYPGKDDPSLAEGLPKYLHDGKTRAKGIHHCKFEYHAGGYSEVIDSTQVRRFFGTRHGTLSKSVEGGGGVMTAAYRDDGHLMARTDPMGATTHFERDARGRVTKVIDPLGQTTVIDRDAAGLPVQVLDAAGGLTQLDRDARGNVLALTDALGGVTSYRHDERGLVTQIVDARGAATTLRYDAQGNCVAVETPSGAQIRCAYDGLGRRIAETDALGGTKRFAYTARGDLLAAYDEAGGVVRYTYDGERRVTQIVGRGGGVTALAWGGYHKLVARRDASGGEVRFRYNPEGELVRVTDERGDTHEITRDASGRIVAEVTFDGRTVRYKNDAAGRAGVITRGDGTKLKLTYDAAGRLVERELADGSLEAFEYDAHGDLTVARTDTCEIRFERDALGQVVREHQRVGDEEHTVDVRYDAAGHRIERRTSLGHHEEVERDLLGFRVRTVLDAQHVIEHALDPLGREIARRLPQGGAIESAYDPTGRLSRRRALGPTAGRPVAPGEPEWLGERADRVTAATSYRYDATGELVEEWDRQRGRIAYEHDPVGRVLSMAPEGARAVLFRYDPTGTAHEGGAGAREYARGGRLLRRGNTTYRWDDAGQLVERRVADAAGGPAQVWTSAWDGAGLLRSVTAPDGTVTEFAYDPLCRRLQKRVSRPSRPGAKPSPVSLTRFVWDGDVLVHEITKAARAGGDPVVSTRTYCFEDATYAPVAHRDDVGPEGWFHYLNDPIGAPDRLIDDAGRVAGELVPDAWGRSPAGAGEARTPLRLPGQYHDEETGLSYNRARYYDPQTGLFISADPIGLRGGVHPFAYAPNTRRWQDPLGLAHFPDKLSGPTRRTPEQQAVIDIAQAAEKRACNEAKANGGKATPMPASDVDNLIRDANTHGVPVRAKNNDITGDHGFGPVDPIEHIHVNGAHVPVPPGYKPPSGSTIITDTGPTKMP